VPYRKDGEAARMGKPEARDPSPAQFLRGAGIMEGLNGFI
jgi:hypothetical protein